MARDMLVHNRTYTTAGLRTLGDVTVRIARQTGECAMRTTRKAIGA